MKYYTLQDVLALDPCHSERKLTTYMAGRKRISLAGILSSKASDTDKIWLTVKLMPTKQAVEFARWCADSIEGPSNGAYISAWEAARAAHDAAYAAWTAAANAAWTAAANAANAACDDAWETARDAWEAAHVVARKAQVSQLKLIVRGCGI